MIDSKKQEIKELKEEIQHIESLPENKLLDPIKQADLRVKKKFLEAKKNELAAIKETTILTSRTTLLPQRACKELPHFFKFPLVKNVPKRKVFETSNGQLQVEPITELIEFQRIKAEITYYGGELGDADRMSWLAVMNQAIRNIEFVKEFGWIPFSLEDIAKEACIIRGKGRSKTEVDESLEKLRLTDVKFLSPFGSFAFRGAFHLIDSVISIEVTKVKDEINNKLDTEKNSIVTIKEFVEQAQAMLNRIKPRTPKITIIKFHPFLMDAIVGHQITTIDMAALKSLQDAGERTLFLYFYDISQWRESVEPFKISIHELIPLLDLKPHIIRSKGKEYIEWSRLRKQIEKKMTNVELVAKFILDWHLEGERETSFLVIQFIKNTIQIPY